MPLLKEQNADLVQHEAIVLDLGDLRQQADQIKQRAREEAERVLAAAQQEAQRLTADGKRAGYEQGVEQGRAEGLAQGRDTGHAEALQQTGEALAQLQQSFTAALERFDAERARMMLDARQSMLELAIDLARRIVKRVPEVDPTVVNDQLAAAVEQMARPADLVVHVHPDDRPLVEAALPELAERLTNLQHARCVDDPTIDRGGCRLAYGRASVDATLDRQLQRIVEALLPAATGETDAAPEAPDPPPPAEQDPHPGRTEPEA